MTPPEPSDGEQRRLQALERTGLLDTPPEPDYDDLASLAAELCGTPIALVSLLHRDRQWFKANVGLPGVTETERCISFCTHAIERESLFLIEDARKDRRFADNPMVTGEPFVRFYAGAPLLTDEGYPIGTLCVIDRRPRRLTESQRRGLMGLKRQVELLLRMRAQLERMKADGEEMARAHEHLRALNARLRAEMDERQRVEARLREQQALLGSVLTHIPHSVFWKDREGAYLGANPRFAQDLGLEDPARVVGKTDLDLAFPRELAERYRADDTAVMMSGQPKLAFEEPLLSTRPEPRWGLTSKVPLKDEAGAVRGVLGIYADISEQRRQQSALQEAKALLERHASSLEVQVREAHLRNHYLMQNSGEAVFLLNEEGHVLDLNPVAQRLLGASEEDLRGTPFAHLAPQTAREPLARALRDLRVVGTVRLNNQLMDSATSSRLMLDLSASLQVTGNTRQIGRAHV